MDILCKQLCSTITRRSAFSILPRPILVWHKRDYSHVLNGGDRNEGSDDPPQKDKSDDSFEIPSRILAEELNSEFPDDGDKPMDQWDSYNQWKHSQSKHAYRPKINPIDTSILLFPGQGSQFVGMGKKLLEYPNVPEMYEVASKILGFDLLNMCINGPKQELDKTKHCQAAILVTSLAAVEKLKHTTPVAIENCVTATGFSVGEIAALTFADVITFEQAVALVKVRGQEMQKASEAEPSGMMTIFLKPNNKVKFACLAAREYCKQKLDMEDPVCEIANYLYTECKVIGGHQQALEFIEKTQNEFGIFGCKRIPVSGAFHTKLMKDASYKVQRFLEKETIKTPAISVHSNLTSHKYRQPKLIKQGLVQQMYKPVKWEQIMHILYSRTENVEFPQTYELGPGKQLGFLLRKTNMKAFKSYYNIDV